MMFAGDIVHHWDGTDNANTPLPTGHYSYRISAESVYRGILSGIPVNTVVKSGSFYHIAPCCIGQTGDFNGDGTDADPLDLAYLHDYLFGTGPLPNCLSEGDVNGDGNSSDPLDLALIVDFLFFGGSPPVQCP